LRNDKKALIFDFNGTLFWDTPYNVSAWSMISEKYRQKGYSLQEQSLLNGQNSTTTARYFLGQNASEEQVLSIVKEKELFYLELCLKEGTPSLAPGAIPLLSEAKRRNMRMAIATGAPLMNMEQYLKWFPLLDYFSRDHIIIENSKRKSKPAPDTFLDAMKALGCSVEESAVFEDSQQGILGANNAGIFDIYAVTPEPRTFSTGYRITAVISDFRQFDLDKE